MVLASILLVVALATGPWLLWLELAPRSPGLVARLRLRWFTPHEPVRVNRPIEAIAADVRMRSARDKLAARGVPINPPEGFDPVPVIAKKLGYSPGRVRSAVRSGWLPPSDVWQRCPEGQIFIRRKDVYPSWRKRA